MEIDFVTLFIIGLLGGFSHCLGMCGGFVVSYTVKLNENEIIARPGFFQRLIPHLMYSSGRILAYMLLGEIFGFLGGSLQVIFAIRDFQGFLQLFAGMVMIFMGLDLAGLIPNLAPDSFPGINAFKRLIHNLFNKVNRRNVFGLGFVLGFIPCGLVYAVGAKAAATGSIFGGMLTMLVFGLGTVPAMVLAGLAAHLISAKLRSRLYKLAAFLIILLGALTILRGIDALGWVQIYWLS
ncbi:MAG TPA: sulfite exporter TauE/SafE family protein [Caldithrix abyssi]|uniref:Sulfite exporter TauE/SafE family protein n=1 Tax=Caldithrix abyssi TaxID=187145 RepID=A0A7V4TXW4_CALAY|nr:sulfite exporter TauE/SafE family protein [Caldithrix abyssi]